MPKKAKKTVHKKTAKKEYKSIKKSEYSKLSAPKLMEGPRVWAPIQRTERREVPVQDLKDVEDDLRDIINWVAVFEQEYDMPKEAVDTLTTRLREIARKVGWLHCH